MANIQIRPEAQPSLFRQIFTTANQKLKSITMRFVSGSRGWAGAVLSPRRWIDYSREVGDGRNSNLIMSVILWGGRTFPEAPIMVEKWTDGSWEDIVDHPMTELIRSPNPFYSGELLVMSTYMDYELTGESYWLKVRAEAGNIVQLWWIPSLFMKPIWPDDGSIYIEKYEYKPDPQKPPIKYDPKDIVHFRFGLDPTNTRRGISQLQTLFREVFTDEEASAFTAALLRNLGVPGVLITPGDKTDIDKPAAEALKVDFREKTTGDRRGDPIVLNSDVKLSILSWSPQQMDLKALRRIPEERVTAIFGIAAIVVGLGAGLDRSTFNNMDEAKKSAYESKLLPVQRLIGSDLRHQLLPEFGDIKGLRVGFDNSEVRVLQEDENQKEERLGKGWERGAIKRKEYRAAFGFEVADEDDVYRIPINVELVGPGAPEEDQNIIDVPSVPIPGQPPTTPQLQEPAPNANPEE